MVVGPRRQCLRGQTSSVQTLSQELPVALGQPDEIELCSNGEGGLLGRHDGSCLTRIIHVVRIAAAAASHTNIDR